MSGEEEVKYTYKQLEKELKESWKDFAKEYFRNGWNKVQAYMKAYPNSKYNSASASAADLLEKPRILAYIEFLKSDLEKTCNISKARQLNELSKIAYSSIANLHNTWILLSDFEKLALDQKAAIESIDTKTVKINFGDGEDSGEKEIEYVKIKLYSKLTAIESINKMMGYNSAEKIEHSGEVKGDPKINLIVDGKSFNMKEDPKKK